LFRKAKARSGKDYNLLVSGLGAVNISFTIYILAFIPYKD